MPKIRIVDYTYDDGGRKADGFKARFARDCSARAMAIASQTPYREMYDALAYTKKLDGGKRTARDGMELHISNIVLEQLGFKWKDVNAKDMTITQAYELYGDCIIRIHRHMLAVMNGVVRDTWDSRFIRKRGKCYQPAVLQIWAHPDNNGPIEITNEIDDPTTDALKKSYTFKVFDTQHPDGIKEIRRHAIKAFDYDEAKRIVGRDFIHGFSLHYLKWYKLPHNKGLFKESEQFTAMLEEDTI